MKVTVQYAGQIRQAIGVGSEQWDVESGLGLKEFLGQIASRHESAIGGFLHSPGDMSSLLVVRNQEQAFPDSGEGLEPGDVIEILSPMSGG